jgi:anaerobic selenocysteine-containing dehydrogenase
MSWFKEKATVKVDRRTFVKGMTFAGGAALGLMLSPTPWYLMRDAAFWTQNWAWLPTPSPGAPSFEDAVCGLCEAGCGIRVRKVDDRLVRIDGNKNHPVNRGSVCPLGVASLQLLYSPARIKTPMKRVDGSWRPVSWEIAIREISQQIQSLRATGQSHAIACITNHRNSAINRMLERLLRAVGSPNFVPMNNGVDAQNIVHQLMTGGSTAAYDIENARCILSFGCSLFEGWGAPGRMYHAQATWLKRPKESQVEVIQIEPNLSTTANKASQWAPITPGTEAALALAIAHVLIRDELYNKAFVKKHCFGFEDWTDSSGKTHKGFASEVLARYSPQSVELITKVPASETEDIARRFASNGPSLAIGGAGRGERFADLYALMAVNSLNALVGNIGQVGGLFTQAAAPVSPLPPVTMDEESARGNATARCDGAGSGRYPFSPSLPHNLDPQKIKVLFIHEANPYYALRDRKSADGIFEKIPYVVSLASHMDESAQRANLVLPVPTPFERWDDLAGVTGVPYATYGVNRPLITPLHDARNAGDIAIMIARSMGGAISDSFPWNNTAEVVAARARGLYESDRGMINEPVDIVSSEGKPPRSLQEKYPTFSTFWSSLLANGCWFDPAFERGKSSFSTPSKKFEFFSQRLHKEFGFSDDLKCMPHYMKPAAKPIGFDLTIMPEELVAMAHDGLGTPPLLIKQLSDTVLRESELFVRINPITAMHHGVKDGDKVILESSRGKVSVRVHTFAGVHEGIVLIPLDFGHTGYDRYLQNKGVNARQLLEVAYDDITGLASCCGTPGKIRKA